MSRKNSGNSSNSNLKSDGRMSDQEDQVPKRILENRNRNKNNEMNDSDAEEGQTYKFKNKDLAQKEEINKIIITKSQIITFLECPKFEEWISGCFIRFKSKNNYFICQIVRVISDVKQNIKLTNLKSISTEKKLKVRYGSYKDNIKIDNVSDSKVTEEELEQFMKSNTLISHDEQEKIQSQVQQLGKWLKQAGKAKKTDIEINAENVRHMDFTSIQKQIDMFEDEIVDQHHKYSTTTDDFVKKDSYTNLLHFLEKRDFLLRFKKERLAREKVHTAEAHDLSDDEDDRKETELLANSRKSAYSTIDCRPTNMWSTHQTTGTTNNAVKSDTNTDTIQQIQPIHINFDQELKDILNWKTENQGITNDTHRKVKTNKYIETILEVNTSKQRDDVIDLDFD